MSPTTNTNTNTNTNGSWVVATVSHTNHAHPPIVTAGKITVETLKEFEKACKRFFRNKRVPDVEQVNRVLSAFEGDDAVAWVSRHEAEFSAEGFTFATFITRLHAKWISDNISYEYGDILNTPQGKRSFDDYEAVIRSANTALAAFPNIHMTNARLREHLKLHFNANLRSQYKHVNGADKALDNIVSYDDWCLRVSRIDEAVHDRLAAEHATFQRRLNELNKENDKKRASNTPNNTSSSSNSNRATTNCKYAMKLTDNERTLLDANDGCCSCRTLWKGSSHVCEYANKPLPYGAVPTITQAYIDERRLERSKALKPSKSSNALKTTTVVAVFDCASSDDDSDNSSGSEPEVFADAVADLHASEYVFPSHLAWSALVCPPSCPAVKIDMLIDHGSPPALICEDLALSLKLPLRKLAVPLKVSGAFPLNSKSAACIEKDVRTLTHYITMPVSSPCLQWTSKPQLFVVAPCLHSDIILGLDFLARNRIIVDASDRSAIVKDLNFDLLHPRPIPAFKLRPPVFPPTCHKILARNIKAGRKEVTEVFKGVLAEIKTVFQLVYDKGYANPQGMRVRVAE
ncbi:hypothetical protein H0H92_009207, partial [Tricholoma furcatifolium]